MHWTFNVKTAEVVLSFVKHSMFNEPLPKEFDKVQLTLALKVKARVMAS